MINHQFLAPRQYGGGYRPRKVQFLELQKTRDLDLDLGQGQGHISVHNTCMTTSIANRVTLVVLAVV